MTTRPQGPDAGSHDTHDRLLVAARAAGDVTGRDQARAELLLAGCDGCRELLGDLRAIAASTRDLPPMQRPAALDFRLTPDHAAALARGRGWRRLLRPFGRTGNGTIRPLAAAFTTLGVAGLLLAALPMLPFAGGAASLPGDAATSEMRQLQVVTFEPSVAPNPGQTGTGEKATAGPAGLAAPAPGDDGARIGDTGTVPTGVESNSPRGPAPLVVLGSGFLGLGIGLYLLRWAALRLR